MRSGPTTRGTLGNESALRDLSLNRHVTFGEFVGTFLTPEVSRCPEPEESEKKVFVGLRLLNPCDSL